MATPPDDPECASVPPPAPEDADATRYGRTPTADPAATRYSDDPLATRYSDDGAIPIPPPTPPVLPSVPGYEILGELGRGGMGVVYQARQLGFNRVVALKMILSGAHAGPDERDRFRTEAEAVARLQHPNIVQVHEVGEHDGRPFFSMEFCPGGGLNHKLGGTPLPPAEAARLVETLARAVDAAHRRNVVHRDLKPSNVLLAADGAPKVTDFGLARKLDEAGRTRTGAVMGTPSYMAPEQAGGRSEEIGPATDVYALGAILYECLTGRPPFRSPNDVDTLMQVLQDEPVPPRRLQSKTPRDLETICLKCLEKQPTRRYAATEGLADDLRRFQAGEPIRARPVGAAERAVKWVRRHVAVSALAAAVLLATALGVAGVVWKYLDAEQQKSVAQQKEKEARQEADKAKKARDFLVGIFKKAETDDKGANVTVRQLLEEADARIPVEFADQPELRADLVRAIGEVKRGIGRRTPQAMILEARGTVLLRSAGGALKPAVPQALLNLDDRLTLGADGQVQVVFVSDFHKERIKPGREAAIDFRGCEPADAIRDRDDSLLMTFVHLPKGTFYRGWDGEQKGVKTELKEDFEIAVHDVTQGQWQAVMGDNPSAFSRNGHGRNDVMDISEEELKLFPVETVSWDDAQAFVKKLNEKERGRGYLYRLPTDAEWEFACRGGATSEEECSYHFSFDKPTNDLSSEQANCDGNYPDGSAPKGKYLARPTRVGAYPSNKLGLCDMHGNAWQWCNDMSDPKGSSRVSRGGAYGNYARYCRAASRGGSEQDFRCDGLGFRLARVPVR